MISCGTLTHESDQTVLRLGVVGDVAEADTQHRVHARLEQWLPANTTNERTKCFI